MPHLDAAALALDKNGLEFLSQVLEVPAGFALPGNAFESSAAWSIGADPRVECEINRLRRPETMVEPA